MNTSQTHLFGYPVLSAEGLERLDRAMARIRPQTAPESSCAYCASIITGNRCESCGAPRRAVKLTPSNSSRLEFPECLHPPFTGGNCLDG